MKKFIVNCQFNGQSAPFSIYIGNPEDTHNPLHFQADWLSKQRGGSIPGEVLDSLAKLKNIADNNHVPLEELCVYALANNEESNSNNVSDNTDTTSVDTSNVSNVTETSEE